MRASGYAPYVFGIQIATKTAKKRVFEGINCRQVERMGSCLGRGNRWASGPKFLKRFIEGKDSMMIA